MLGDEPLQERQVGGGGRGAGEREEWMGWCGVGQKISTLQSLTRSDLNFGGDANTVVRRRVIAADEDPTAALRVCCSHSCLCFCLSVYVFVSFFSISVSLYLQIYAGLSSAPTFSLSVSLFFSLFWSQLELIFLSPPCLSLLCVSPFSLCQCLSSLYLLSLSPSHCQSSIEVHPFPLSAGLPSPHSLSACLSSLYRSPLSLHVSPLSTGLPSLYRSPLSLQVYPLFTSLPSLSTSPPLSACLSSLYRSPLSLQVSPLSTGLPSLYKSPLSLQLPSLYRSTLSLQVSPLSAAPLSPQVSPLSAGLPWSCSPSSRRRTWSGTRLIAFCAAPSSRRGAASRRA